ncbi:hypothetical protein LUU34_01601900 [Aix galericulata]|nr:hypothetical protein LUU34_01601900 [Aix galericulata]
MAATPHSMPLRPSVPPAPPPALLSAPGTRCRLLRFSGLSARKHAPSATMFRPRLTPPAAVAPAARPPPPLGWPPLSPPSPLLALWATAGILAKDVGGSPEKAATDLSSENKKQ